MFTAFVSLSPDGDARLQADVEKVTKERAEIQEKLGLNTFVDSDGYAISPQLGNTMPPRTLPNPSPPVSQFEPIEEAHLHLSPVCLAGATRR